MTAAEIMTNDKAPRIKPRFTLADFKLAVKAFKTLNLPIGGVEFRADGTIVILTARSPVDEAWDEFDLWDRAGLLDGKLSGKTREDALNQVQTETETVRAARAGAKVRGVMSA